jgi:serine/threonine-protein kinase
MIGRTLSHFEVTAKLGEGGMGKVYRATDSKLGREVAIKVLPAEFVADEDRLARFEREARMLAALNHPNVAGIHEVGQEGGVHFLVMELAVGETLAELVKRGPLSRDQAIRTALQIAEGLEAAHERGIVHRDLKPANVMVDAGGGVKILDFGLAKAWAEGAAGEGALSMGATLTAEMTQPGAILGTAAYMSPEQASGEPADKRSDIWSFGVVVVEMLTGKRLFGGPSPSATLAAVLKDPVSLENLPADTPPPVRLLVARCLARDRTRRLRDIGEARIALEAAQSGRDYSPLVAAAAATAGAETRASSRRWLLGGLGAILLVVAAIVIGRSLESPTEDPQVSRLVVPVPSALQLHILDGAYAMALSVDGRRLAYVASEEDELAIFVRDLAGFDATRVTGTDGASYPFFSPDGEWLGFFARGSLHKIPVTGGAPRRLCDANPTRGGAWSPNGFIYFSENGGGLFRISEAGGERERVETGQAELDGKAHYFPYALPDGSGVITHPRDRENPGPANRLALLDIARNEWTSLPEGTQAQYVDPGFLLVHVGRGDIEAIPFDLASHEVTGEPLPVLGGVYRAPNFGGAFFAVSTGGTLAFLPGGFDRELKRVTREGRETSLVDEIRGFRMPRLSPDGRRLAVVVDPRPSEVWVYDLGTATRSKLSRTAHSLVPVWTPEGAAVTFTASSNLHRAPADGSRPPERVLELPVAQYAGSWSPDGATLVYWDTAGESTDIWLLAEDGSRHAVVAGDAHEWEARLSPDGRWLAYQSWESGQIETYVVAFPDGSNKRTVSRGGGRNPAWSSDGREIFYHDGESMFAVSVSVGATLEVGKPERLFGWPEGLVHNFDVFPDGQSFVMVRTDPDDAPDRFRVVLNWSRELEERFSSGS